MTFSTAVSYNPATPTVTAPDFATVYHYYDDHRWGVPITFTGSAFSSLIGATHINSQWEVTGDVMEVLGSTLTTYSIVGTIDSSGYDGDVYGRVRYQDSNGNWSAWSAVESVRVEPTPDTGG